MRKFCPMKFNVHRADWYCEEHDCAWWVESVGGCGVVVEAWMKGLKVEKLERELELKREAYDG